MVAKDSELVERPVRPYLIVFSPPSFQLLPGVRQIIEPVHIAAGKGRQYQQLFFLQIVRILAPYIESDHEPHGAAK